jgi:hypothetical protein
MTKTKVFSPYGRGWVIQEWPDLATAERMVAFYKSCGSPASVLH